MTKTEIMLKKSTTDLYFKLLEFGLDSFISDYNERGFNRAIAHLERMISYFETKEEYEKCMTLREYLSLTKGFQNANKNS